MSMKSSATGRFTHYFIESPLTLLMFLSIFVVGFIALLNLPREEEPQISVPMVDVFLNTNGLKAADGVELVTKPLEVILKGIHGVDHIYSQTQDDSAMITVRFNVGYSPDKAILHVHERIRAHLNEIPYGIQMPLVDLKSIDDVAILVLNLVPRKDVAHRYTDTTLYEIAEQVRQNMIQLQDMGTTTLIGGRPSQIRVEPILDNLLKYEIALEDVVYKIQSANNTGGLGKIYNDHKSLNVSFGQSFKTVDDLKEMMITNQKGKSVYLKDIASIDIDGKNTFSRAWFYDKETDDFLPTVAIALAKKPGANAVIISKQVEKKLESLKGNLIPSDVDVKITRDYGETANEKSNHLLGDLLGATLSVVLLVGLFIGWREAIVVFFVVPLTILGTLFIAWILGYTINRVSLFALIFSIGILVDDAIVFIENIVRHWRENPHENKIKAAVDGVVEVGNPTIVATFTIIVALLPMLFVSGLMGPYMSPIPINASVAMILSLLIAFMIVPWLLIKVKGDHLGHHDHESKLSKIYRKYATILVYNRDLCKKFIKYVGIATLLACGLFVTKSVTVKMLPFDNKSELVIQLDLPKNATVEDTDKYLKMMNSSIKNVPELLDTQLYVGTAAPFNFNGLVRHTYLRHQPNMGEIQVNLLPKKERKRSSHQIALDIRSKIKALTYPDATVVKVLEVPPGPPVLSTLLAEVYAPTAKERRDLATKLKGIYQHVPYLTDIDDSFGVQAQKQRFTILKDRMDAYQTDEASIHKTLSMLMGETTLGYVHHTNGRYPTEISMTLSNKNRVMNDALLSIFIRTKTGFVDLSNVVEVQKEEASYPIFRHNGHDIEMVMAELAGEYEAPIYGMLAVNSLIKSSDWLQKPDILFNGQPQSNEKASILWDGEWEITYVTFRDMGAAFIIALLGIYALLVAQFKSFRTPIVILVPIPLVLVGIILGHLLFGASFTATSMIGLIALAGIVVRNSLLLVEFIKFRLREGDALQKALIDAGATRITPIFMTAIAAMIGAVFMFFDPIFQGLAISLFFGLMSSTFLTLFSIPAIYIIAKTK